MNRILRELRDGMAARHMDLPPGTVDIIVDGNDMYTAVAFCQHTLQAYHRKFPNKGVLKVLSVDVPTCTEQLRNAGISYKVG